MIGVLLRCHYYHDRLLPMRTLRVSTAGRKDAALRRVQHGGRPFVGPPFSPQAQTLEIVKILVVSKTLKS